MPFLLKVRYVYKKKYISAYRQVPAATAFAPYSSFLYNGSGVKPDFTFVRDYFKIT